jgi:cobalamin biosynthesis protein CbiG
VMDDLLVIGVGTRRGVSAAEIDALIQGALADANLSAGAVAHVATVEGKVGEPALQMIAAERGWLVIGWPAARLASVAVPHPSARVETELGTASVAEAAAVLDATGRPTGTLVVTKRRSTAATVAIATHPVRADRVG